ncbi:MAG TPA: CapA family protein [Gaiellaceae bacterium]|nr:CapA family protein [Gaiellaceae bacterium]
MRRRLFAAAAVAAIAGGAAAIVLRAGFPSAAEARAVPLRVTTRLPGWRAPGVPVTVRGFAGEGERLRLRAGGHTLATAVAGRLGGFRLRFTTGAPGRYPLVVQGEGRTRAAGRLLVRAVVLDAVGDVTFGEQVGPGVEQHGAAYPWRGVAGTLRAADVTAGNLETAVSTRGEPVAKRYTFRGPPRALPAMAKLAGFDVLTLANNHSGDYGSAALLDTLRHVRAAGILPIGAGGNERQARRPAILDAGGLRIAFLGYSDVNPLGFPATATTPGTARADTAAIDADVRAARRRADVVVCFFHWGTELHPDPDVRQQQFAAACLNAGAKLVLGAHPHVLGPLARPDRRSLVAWSLGNFVFPSSGTPARTAILRVELDRRGVRGYRLLPVAIDGYTPRLVPAA